jgi:2-C-methyl-D-erythritol 2,4-cyclodiphosphate synthase
LRRVISDLAERGWRVGNIDATVVAQAPKMAPHIPTMCENLASDLQVERGAVNVKATTTEKLGFAGREEGIAAHAVALIEKVVE